MINSIEAEVRSGPSGFTDSGFASGVPDSPRDHSFDETRAQGGGIREEGVNALTRARPEDLRCFERPPKLVKGPGQALTRTRLRALAEHGLLRALSHATR
eukprot:4382952-Heterocapsa_arctica.AAC.1